MEAGDRLAARDLARALRRVARWPGTRLGALARRTTVLAPGLSLPIVEHPCGGPVKLAVGAAGVEAVNQTRTRLTYYVNTNAGSSGSPSLRFDLELVALHHSGKAHHAEGVPVATIVAHLGNAGLAALRGT